MLLVLFLFNTEEGRTSTFNVSPLKVVSSGKSSSALMEITNQSAERLRLQLSVSSWDQSPAGEMLLRETDDIILFPPLLTVEPGEKKGSASEPSPREAPPRRAIGSCWKNSRRRLTRRPRHVTRFESSPA